MSAFWLGVSVFGAALVLDFVWARYNIACAQLRTLASGVYGLLIYLLNAIVILQYVHQTWLILPAAAGAFFGNIAGVWTKRKGWGA